MGSLEFSEYGWGISRDYAFPGHGDDDPTEVFVREWPTKEAPVNGVALEAVLSDMAVQVRAQGYEPMYAATKDDIRNWKRKLAIYARPQ